MCSFLIYTISSQSSYQKYSWNLECVNNLKCENEQQIQVQLGYRNNIVQIERFSSLFKMRQKTSFSLVYWGKIETRVKVLMSEIRLHTWNTSSSVHVLWNQANNNNYYSKYHWLLIWAHSPQSPWCFIHSLRIGKFRDDKIEIDRNPRARDWSSFIFFILIHPKWGVFPHKLKIWKQRSLTTLHSTTMYGMRANAIPFSCYDWTCVQVTKYFI